MAMTNVSNSLTRKRKGRRRHSWPLSSRSSWSVVRCPSKMIELHVMAKGSQTCSRWLQWVRITRVTQHLEARTDHSSPRMMIRFWAQLTMKFSQRMRSSSKTQQLTTVTIDQKFAIWLIHLPTKRLFESTASMQTRPWLTIWKIFEKLAFILNKRQNPIVLLGTKLCRQSEKTWASIWAPGS